MLSQQIVDQIRTNLVSALDPLEIYIFGSQVWGKTHKYSDVDIFVVVEKERTFAEEREFYARGHDALYDIDMPSDLLVMPKREFAKRSKLPHMLPYKIKNEGMKIFTHQKQKQQNHCAPFFTIFNN